MNQQQTLSLKRIIIFSFLVITFIPLGILTISSYLTHLHTINSLKDEQQASTAKTATKIGEAFLDEQIKYLDQTFYAKKLAFLSNEKEIQEALNKQNEYANQLRKISYISDIHFICTFSPNTRQKNQNQDLLKKLPINHYQLTSDNYNSTVYISKAFQDVTGQKIVLQKQISTHTLKNYLKTLNSNLAKQIVLYDFNGEVLSESKQVKFSTNMGQINQIATFDQNSGQLNAEKNKKYGEVYYEKSTRYPIFSVVYTNTSTIAQFFENQYKQVIALSLITLVIILLLALFASKMIEQALNKMKNSFIEASHGQFEITDNKKKFDFWELFTKQLHLNNQVSEISEFSDAYHYMLAEFACFHSDITQQINELNVKFEDSQFTLNEFNQAIDEIVYHIYQEKHRILHEQNMLYNNEIDNTNVNTFNNLSIEDIEKEKDFMEYFTQKYPDFFEKIELLHEAKDMYTIEMSKIYESFVRMYISLHEFNENQLGKK